MALFLPTSRVRNMSLVGFRLEFHVVRLRDNSSRYGIRYTDSVTSGIQRESVCENGERHFFEYFSLTRNLWRTYFTMGGVVFDGNYGGITRHARVTPRISGLLIVHFKYLVNSFRDAVSDVSGPLGKLQYTLKFA